MDSDTPIDVSLVKLLKLHWGASSFRAMQLPAVKALLNKEDVLLVWHAIQQDGVAEARCKCVLTTNIVRPKCLCHGFLGADSTDRLRKVSCLSDAPFSFATRFRAGHFSTDSFSKGSERLVFGKRYEQQNESLTSVALERSANVAVNLTRLACDMRHWLTSVQGLKRRCGTVKYQLRSENA